MDKKSVFIVIVLAVGFASIGLGILIGRQISSSPTGTNDNPCSQNVAKQKKLKLTDEELFKHIRKSNIKENVRILSSKSAVAGSEREEELGRLFYDKFLEAGFDFAEMVPYNVLLSFPNASHPNKMIIKKQGSKIYESADVQPTLKNGDNAEEFPQAYFAFSSAGTVSTPSGRGIVYVNYCRMEDFLMLEAHDISVKGHIVLCRFGKGFRGSKIMNAAQFGATGVLMFLSRGSKDSTYPDSDDAPDSAIRIGQIKFTDGDPLTPGWPSIESAYRISFDEIQDLPKIPSQPISRTDAHVILKMLGGGASPGSWQSRFDNVTYNFGPVFRDEFSDTSVTLSTYNYFKETKIYNVFGYIKGLIEPDRYVIMGNHRDAWGFGALDPASAAGSMLEVIRNYGQFLKQGWRPRRTILFCSWSAEEFALTGSTEWVEEKEFQLKNSAVTYINTDICKYGDKVGFQTSPLLDHFLYSVTKRVNSPFGNGTIFDYWKMNDEMIFQRKTDFPKILRGSGSSDHFPFVYKAGLPVILFFFSDFEMHTPYHTAYDNFNLYSNYFDPEMKYGQSCAEIVTLLVHDISEQPLLPMNVTNFAHVIRNEIRNIQQSDLIKSIYDKYPLMERAADNLIEAAKAFTDRNEKNAGEMSELELRTVNDQLMKMEQIFIIPEGIPGQSESKHLLYSSTYNKFHSSPFMVLKDLLFRYDKLSIEDRKRRNKQLSKYISDVTIALRRAASNLKDSHLTLS